MRSPASTATVTFDECGMAFEAPRATDIRDDAGSDDGI
jgi:hypothetical protein